LITAWTEQELGDASRNMPFWIGADGLLLETGNEECGFVLQIAVSLRNAFELYLALFVGAMLTRSPVSIGIEIQSVINMKFVKLWIKLKR
jgi:hypothetical protein